MSASKAASSLAARLARRSWPGGWPALMYHAVEVADGLPESEDYTVSASLFARHLLALERAGVASVPLLRLLHGDLALSPGEAPLALITFDDGFESVLTRASEPLAESDLAALAFITVDRIGEPGYLDADQVRVLLGMGLAVGSHGLTHRYLTDLPLGELRRELAESRDRLSALVGYPVRTLSAPGGRVDDRVMAEARRAGYRAVMGSEPGLVPYGDPPPGPSPRLAITERTTPAHIERLAVGDPAALIQELARYKALQVPKRLLGNAGYDAVRGALLGAWRGRRGPA